MASDTHFFFFKCLKIPGVSSYRLVESTSEKYLTWMDEWNKKHGNSVQKLMKWKDEKYIQKLE